MVGADMEDGPSEILKRKCGPNILSRRSLTVTFENGGHGDQSRYPRS